MTKRRLSSVIAIVICASVHGEMTIETVLVGNPGNLGEWSGESYGGYGPDHICGSVDYVYSIGKYEITAGQYCGFLNAVAAADVYELYDDRMADPRWEPGYPVAGCNIIRDGVPGEYTYTVPTDWANRPVNYVSWSDAARFCNWLHNNQPIGVLTGDPIQDACLTEDGSYDVNGAMFFGAIMDIVRKPNATWVIPTEDEWYKAAYHKNDGVTGNYFDYPTSSDLIPSNGLVAPDPGNNATFFQNGYTIDSPYFRTEVDEHENSESPYGTFDQGGNVYELNETIIGSYRGLRGTAFNSQGIRMHAAYRYSSVPSSGIFYTGFRVAHLAGTPIPGDIDSDGDVDDDDVDILIKCLAGPECSVPPGSCMYTEFTRADLDGDSDVDLSDFLIIQQKFPGGTGKLVR